jgi:hypothetical protein
MKDETGNVVEAQARRLSRREVLGGLVAVVATPVVLETAWGEGNRARSKRSTARSKGSPIKALPRHQHTATPLPNGQVLVAGGFYHGPLTNVQIYCDGVWSSAAHMNTPRYQHAATLLADGRVLVLGGFYHGPMSDVEIYDPETDTWSSARPLAIPRYQHAAVLLPDGSVLVTGGCYLGPLADPEIYTV